MIGSTACVLLLLLLLSLLFHILTRWLMRNQPKNMPQMRLILINFGDVMSLLLVVGNYEQMTERRRRLARIPLISLFFWEEVGMGRRVGLAKDQKTNCTEPRCYDLKRDHSREAINEESLEAVALSRVKVLSTARQHETRQRDRFCSHSISCVQNKRLSVTSLDGTE